MSLEIAWKQNILVTDFHLLKSLLVVFGFGSQAFVCGFSRQNICSVVQFSKFDNFLWLCWFLGKNLSNFISPVWKLHNPYCHKCTEEQFTSFLYGEFTIGDLRSSMGQKVEILVHFYQYPPVVFCVSSHWNLFEQTPYIQMYLLVTSQLKPSRVDSFVFTVFWSDWFIAF